MRGSGATVIAYTDYGRSMLKGETDKFLAMAALLLSPEPISWSFFASASMLSFSSRS